MYCSPIAGVRICAGLTITVRQPRLRDRPCPHPGLNTRSSRSHGLNPWRWRLPLALRLQVSNELLSVRAGAPVTRYFLRLSTPAGRPGEATPSLQRLAAQALHDHGRPPPASSARRGPVGLKLLPHFEGRACRYLACLKKTPQRNEQLARYSHNPNPSSTLPPIPEALTKPAT